MPQMQISLCKTSYPGHLLRPLYSWTVLSPPIPEVPYLRQPSIPSHNQRSVLFSCNQRRRHKARQKGRQQTGGLRDTCRMHSQNNHVAIVMGMCVTVIILVSLSTSAKPSRPVSNQGACVKCIIHLQGQGVPSTARLNPNPSANRSDGMESIKLLKMAWCTLGVEEEMSMCLPGQHHHTKDCHQGLCLCKVQELAAQDLLRVVLWGDCRH
jgi:hypothetical protein